MVNGDVCGLLSNTPWRLCLNEQIQLHYILVQFLLLNKKLGYILQLLIIYWWSLNLPWCSQSFSDDVCKESCIVGIISAILQIQPLYVCKPKSIIIPNMKNTCSLSDILTTTAGRRPGVWQIWRAASGCTGSGSTSHTYW